MNLNQAKAVMLRTHMGALLAAKRPNAIELVSAPGVGKSSSVAQYARMLAKMLGVPVGVVTFMLATVSSVDVRGFMIPVAGAGGKGLDTVFSTPPWYPVLANTTVVTPDGTIHPEGTWTGPIPTVGIVFLDEWGQADDEVKKPAAELMLHGRVGNTVLPMGWRVVAASNRMKDRSGVERPMKHIVNRRCETIVDSDVVTFLEYHESQPKEDRLHHMTMSFASKNPGVVFTDAVPEGNEPFCTPRSLCLMDADLRSLRSEAEAQEDRMPMDPIAKEVCQGWIGPGAAAQYFVHLKYADVIPTIESVVRDPMRAKLPEKKDEQMVCGYMLASHISEDNATPVVRYMNRLTKEMQVLTVRAAKARPESVYYLTQNPEFAKWSAENAALLLASRE